MDTKTLNWEKVSNSLDYAKAIAWDECHKIYVLMDDNQVNTFRSYGYDPLITKDVLGSKEMLWELQSWYENSCELRFIDSVSTVDGDPNEGFITLIGQFEDEYE